MTKAKHTPGPWSVGLDSINCNILEIMGDRYTVAECNAGGVRMNNEMLFANAHLISAAPDLLTVLKLSNNILEALHASESRADARIMLGKQIMANRAVMEKAGGQ